MRVWTLHPKYLDPQGLVALWRETLLAQKVLRGETKGYRNHPQLLRFREQERPRSAIASYLTEVLAEASKRGYSFDESNILQHDPCTKIEETRGQLLYEWEHLKAKLATRCREKYDEAKDLEVPEAHPLFHIVPGNVRDWEKRQSII
ncbi:MAG: pyrimidine dimer DNA glycosylase/endonuclease V [Armatimonadota bacterium]|nr:pyrimidine dimer DNA glycosylase/endonuclease V [Armatimonadota bacterium]